jgi:hypothetical protein
MKRQLLVSIEPAASGMHCGDCRLIDRGGEGGCNLFEDWHPYDFEVKDHLRLRRCLEAEAMATGVTPESAPRHQGDCQCASKHGFGVTITDDGRCERCGRPAKESDNRRACCSTCRAWRYCAPHGDQWLCEEHAPKEGAQSQGADR